MFFVYVLYSKISGKFYIGYTENLKRRIVEHEKGKVYSTARMGKSELIFYECFASKDDAVRRENYFKTTKGKKSLRLILRESVKSIECCPVV